MESHKDESPGASLLGGKAETPGAVELGEDQQGVLPTRGWVSHGWGQILFDIAQQQGGHFCV